MSRGRLIYVIFFLTVALIGTIHLRNSSSRLFSRYFAAKSEQRRLVEELRKKQLELEQLITPASVSDILRKNEKPAAPVNRR
jgi:hypothetical protein